MNDQHPPAGHVGYDGRSTGSFDTDPLFGSLSGDHSTGYDTGLPAAGYGDGAHGAGYATAYATGQPDHHSGQYDASAWNTGAQQTLTHDDGPPAQDQLPQVPQQWDASGTWQQVADQDGTGAFPTTGFSEAPYGTGSAYPAAAYAAGAYATDAYDTGTYPTGTAYGTGAAYGGDAYGTGAYPVGAYGSAADTADTGTYATTAFTTGTLDPGATQDTGAYDTGAYTVYGTAAYDTGAYDATAWNSGATPGDTAYGSEQMSDSPYEQRSADAAAPEGPAGPDRPAEEPGADPTSTAAFPVLDQETAPESVPDVTPAPDAEEGFPVPPSVDRTAVRAPASRGRARRRSPAKRSALLTVAVPSACVMSVAGIAAASVGGLPGDDKPEERTTAMTVADPASAEVVAANSRLDSQLEQLSEGSDDFRERASRTQERIDLRERQAAEKKKREDEAARREALRPKFVLPVKQHGLSAYYGQAGINWMSAHTGIDFPVDYGVPVMAATDGTVQTRWNSAYGNMVIVTAADGTETWYCHLSSARVRSGHVKAGDVIGYAGSSGNSTGAHLHFEVRPAGGASIDPLAWLRSKGLNPT
ncbi:peptidoglycan DD-metalloendopeptidase family protein [Streptomyces sp. DH8]|uniref:peptidoglycan DD-metalloendopeptidase family protein n=1 Tax=Streptomyces sp. DH8 TaxID=2857008 RepID=UPI001E3CC1FD|nr:peptidoglycan DD-metalloendopeptidase family protein [Streptomyces sp. DH8]